jgi:glucosylceramidase
MKLFIRQYMLQIVFFALLLTITPLIGCSKGSTGGGTETAPPTPPAPTPPVNTASDVIFYKTTGNQSSLFAKQNTSLVFGTASNQFSTIIVDSARQYQTIDGFGYTLTGGSADLINSLPANDKSALLRELFSSDSAAIGVSYLRISIGASDLNASVFTYDEVAAGATDETLQNFTLERDRLNLIPVLKQIIAINPNIKILACPWTAPTWMKINTNAANPFKGGKVNPAYYGAFANYFVKYIQAMKAEGITIDAITPQNEPLNPDNNPSMVMTATEQTDFIKNYLGPKFQAANLSTKIIIYDHNCDHPEYPLAVLSDAGARQFVDGSAFHLYAGSIDALTPVHDAYPSKNVYFTEQWTSSTGSFDGDLTWHVKNLVIGASRNWSKNVLEWNLANDPNYAPHTPGGCSACKGALTINGNSINRNVSYYIIAHASKFVTPGSVRVASNIINNLHNVAFITPQGKKVLIVVNDNSTTQSFNIMYKEKQVTTSLEAGAVGTYTW